MRAASLTEDEAMWDAVIDPVIKSPKLLEYTTISNHSSTSPSSSSFSSSSSSSSSSSFSFSSAPSCYSPLIEPSSAKPISISNESAMPTTHLAHQSTFPASSISSAEVPSPSSMFSSSAVVYGIINTIMALPSMYGYAAAIFRDPIYSADMACLAKLVCFSSAVHQVCFMTLSAMPFAIGQVQDAGLIFLSKIATDIAARAQVTDVKGDATEEELEMLRQQVVVSTCVVVLGISTACLGLLLVIVGRARLAKYVAYLPMPVISGYLGFIGLFCIEAGLSLCTGLPIQQLSDWAALLVSFKAALLSIPGLLAGLILCLVSRYAQHEAILPATMIAMPLFFYAALFTGQGACAYLDLSSDTCDSFSLDQARAFGWLGSDTDAGSVSDVVALFDFELVDWRLLPQQLPVFASMVFVVAFSSCLDVAAIEMDVGRPLDVNSELTVVGWSNVVSGLLGGFTGSYIFSQTIFTCRSRCHSRTVGAVVAAAELAVVGLRVNLLAYVPLFFFAATLIFIGFDLMSEWLVDVRHKLDPMEYGVVLLTFVAIEVLSLNRGLAVGVLGSALQFLIRYANQDVVSQVDRQSMVMRTAAASAVIHHQYQRGTIATLELRGSLFFMSSLKILEEVRGVLAGSGSNNNNAIGGQPVGGDLQSQNLNGTRHGRDEEERGFGTDKKGAAIMAGWRDSLIDIFVGEQSTQRRASDCNDNQSGANVVHEPYTTAMGGTMNVTQDLEMVSSQSSLLHHQRLTESGPIEKTEHVETIGGSNRSSISSVATKASSTARAEATPNDWQGRRVFPTSPELSRSAHSVASARGRVYSDHGPLISFHTGGPATSLSTSIRRNHGYGAIAVQSHADVAIKSSDEYGIPGRSSSWASIKGRRTNSMSRSPIMHPSLFERPPGGDNMKIGSEAGTKIDAARVSNDTSAPSSVEPLRGSSLARELESYEARESKGDEKLRAQTTNGDEKNDDNATDIELSITAVDSCTGKGGTHKEKKQQYKSRGNSVIRERGDQRVQGHERQSSGDSSNRKAGWSLLSYGADHSLSNGSRSRGSGELRTSPPRYLVLDFTRVPSIDATMVHSCFTPIARLTKSLGCHLVYAACNTVVTAQLRNHGAFEGNHIRIFRTVHRALDWCESAVIAGAQRRLHRSSHSSGSGAASRSSRRSRNNSSNHPNNNASNSSPQHFSPLPSLSSQNFDQLPNSGDSSQKRLSLTTATNSIPTGELSLSEKDGDGDAQLDQREKRSPSIYGRVGTGGSHASVNSLTVSELRAVKVATLLRQWLELRPQAPPACVRPWLFLGGAHHACDRALLRQLNIRYVLNVADDVPNFFEGENSHIIQESDSDCGSAKGSDAEEAVGDAATSNGSGRNVANRKMMKRQKEEEMTLGIEYFNLQVADYGQDTGISRVFSDAFDFARRVRMRKKGNLLVHCRYGMNRSPTLVTALLMELEDLSLAEAWRQLKAIHSEAYPQRDNRRELVRFERLRNEAKAAALDDQKPGGTDQKEPICDNAQDTSTTNTTNGGLSHKNEGAKSGSPFTASTESPTLVESPLQEVSSSATSSTFERVSSFNSMMPEDFHAHDPNDDADQMQRYCRTESYAADEAIFQVGEYAEDLFILLGGTVDLFDADGNLELTLSPGNVFGFVDSQLGKPRSTSAYARRHYDGSELNLLNQRNSSDSMGDIQSVHNTAETESASLEPVQEWVVRVAAISMASLEKMSTEQPRIAIKLMKVLLRQSSLELSNVRPGAP